MENIRSRIGIFFTPDLADSLIPLFHQEAGLSLNALIAPPTHVKSQSKSIHTFLNGRAIRDRTVLHAVIESYRDAIPRDRYPIAFLFLGIDPREVDVNVHPAKIEVRFRNSGKIHALVQALIRETLGHRSAPPPAMTLKADPLPPRREQRSFPLQAEAPSPQSREGHIREALDAYLSGHSPPSAVSPLPPPDGERGLAEAAGTLPTDGKPFLQVHNAYIVRETDDGIEIIDQHALNERVLYNEIRPRVEKEGLQAQRLLVPLTLDLDRARASLLEGNLDLFVKFGLEINRFGPSTFAVQTIPPLLPDGEVIGFIEDVLVDLAENAHPSSGRRIEETAKRLACHSAVKAGERLNEVALRTLLGQAAGLPPAPTCPHGRPAIIRIPLVELERSFGRR
ncbi:MAG: DNA mismatch repair MutL family protein [Planctomycetota bacterium]